MAVNGITYDPGDDGEAENDEDGEQYEAEARASPDTQRLR